MARADDATNERNERSEPQDQRPDTRDHRGYLGTSAAPSVAPIWKRRLYVERVADLSALAAELQRARIIAIDAEFTTLNPYMRHSPDEPSHRLALLQLALDNDYSVSYVVDALRLADLAPLHAPLAAAASLKLFHGAGSDARVLAGRNLVAKHTLDLEAVSRSIFGQRESGLQAMLQRACGIRLDKSLQRADWARRPLTPAMVAYAAHDAEMTLALYDWLALNYRWAVTLYQIPADEALLPIATWIQPYFEGGRQRPVQLALEDAGIAEDRAAQERDLRLALQLARRPNERARVMRIITELELSALTPEVYPYVSALAAEERAGAARVIGRLRDVGAAARLQPLLDDPVEDVRDAARLALDTITTAPRPARGALGRRSGAPASGQSPAQHEQREQRKRGHTPGGALRWTSGASEAPGPTAGDWRATLLATLGADKAPAAASSPPAAAADEGDAKG